MTAADAGDPRNDRAVRAILWGELRVPSPGRGETMWRRPTSSTMPSPEEALPGPIGAHAGAEVALRERRAARAAVSRGDASWRSSASGCFWGAERKFWQTPGVVSTSRRLRGRLHAEPDLRGGLLRPHRPRRGRARRLRPERRSSYEELLRVFWESHDPTQGMRQGNDVGTQYRSAIYTYGEEQRADGRGLARRVPEGARRGRPRRDHDRDPRRPPSSTTPRTTTSSTSRRTRTATAASAARASPARSGSRGDAA